METRTPTSSICDKIASFAAAMPDAIALKYGSETLSYRELERKSAQVASFLRGSGVLSGGTVVICMERSFDWIAAALGAMRAGAAYVPLDHGWAKERLSFAVQDSGASIVIARESLLSDLGLQVTGFDPERDAALLGAVRPCELEPIESDALAYVIYTSGSTGVPKGVEISHANLNNLSEWHHSAFELTSKDRTSHLAGLGFDAAVWELWPALVAGRNDLPPTRTRKVFPGLAARVVGQRRDHCKLCANSSGRRRLSLLNGPRTQGCVTS